MDQEACHASAPVGYKCSDCTIDQEPCPACYKAWWQKRHPSTHEVVINGHWTKEPPTETGWYGWRGIDIIPLNFVSSRGGELVAWHQIEGRYIPAEQMGGEWWSEKLTFPWEEP